MSCADRGGWRNIVNPQKLKEQRVKGQGKDVIEGPQQQMGKSSLHFKSCFFGFQQSASFCFEHF